MSSHVKAPFTALATVYDRIMADIEYGDWAEHILMLAEGHGFRGGKVLDLGCGTGNSTLPLLEAGLEVEGLDASREMLTVAAEKLPSVTFHLGTFEKFELSSTFALIVSVFDSLNNLLTHEAFSAMLQRVITHLEPGGVFVFDVNTEAGLKELWAGGVASGLADGVYYRWEHSFDTETGLARVEAYCDSVDGAFTEVHYERGYGPDELGDLLTTAGFERVVVSDHPDGGEPTADSDRLWVVARKPRAGST